MRRRLLAVALSAATGIGGHFLNQRWDRALLFLALLVSFPVVGFIGGSMLLPALGVRAETYVLLLGLLAAGTLLAWLASIVVTFFDSGSRHVPVPLRWTWSGRCGAGLASLLATVSMLFTVIQFAPLLFLAGPLLTAGGGDTGRTAAVTPRADDHFFVSLHFGGMHRTPVGLAPPPTGTAALTGRFLYDGKPAAGVVFQLALNGEYETPALTTDAAGRFRLPLPAGEWRINYVHTSAWPGRPREGEYLLVSGNEGRLQGERYDAYVLHRGEGLPVTLAAGAAAEPLTFTIRRRVTLEWPGLSDRKANATHSASTIRWLPYPQASDYVVRIARVERVGGGARYYEVVNRRVRGATQMPLAALKAVPGTASGAEYQVEVAAFDADGRFLSETASHLDGQSFTLTDVSALADRELADTAASGESLAEMLANRKRLDAVEALIGEGLLPEARKMLARVRGATSPGRKEALSGYLLAREGKCAEAERQFTQAAAAGGTTCVPDAWRAACRR